MPGLPHHVTQPGNRRADIFECDEDREVYLRLLGKYMKKYGVSLWAYCLMSNHVHLVLVPAAAESLSRCLRDTHTVYATHFNKRTQLSGHVWQGRFFSCALDEAHLWAAVRYVERNPVRAGIVEKAEEFSWSSAAGHCGLKEDKLLAGEFPPVGVVDDWPTWLADEDPAYIEAVRKHTHTGRPCGSRTFLEGLEELLGKRLRPRKAGRKPKEGG
ncbi:transposase [Candidatus Hydrogenedentota bacterium]